MKTCVFPIFPHFDSSVSLGDSGKSGIFNMILSLGVYITGGTI